MRGEKVMRYVVVIDDDSKIHRLVAKGEVKGIQMDGKISTEKKIVGDNELYSIKLITS